MRVGLVNSTRAWGGGEQWFLDAAQALSARGHEVALAAAEGGDLAARARRAGLPVVRPAEIRGDVVLVNSRRDLADVLRAHRAPPFALVLRRGIDRPLHDHLLRRPAWRRLSAILANSRATEATVRRSLPWFPADRIRVLHNPVTFAPAPRVPARGPWLRLGAAGRLVRQKGFPVLLRATALLPAASVRLEIAGDGGLSGRLGRQARRLGLADRCAFLGHLPDLAPFYARQDVIAVPSRYEGFCFVAVEAALAGLPVVASDVSSLREIVLPEATGLLVTPGDHRALADALSRLAADPARREALGRRAREEAERRFRPEPLHEALSAFLTEAAGLGPVGDET